MKHMLRRLIRDERGMTTVEYIIVLSLIAVVGFGVWKKFGTTVKSKVQAADAVMVTLPTSSTPQ
ncbi:MAG: Flp family type IVb pilin [Myxococcales bacterium]|nr:MAG: Flp family type IVb pilin [Myxococcales bacterium]